MKTNTLKSTKRLFLCKKNILAFALFGYGITNAQVQNNSTIYVSDNTEFYVASGTYNFGTAPAATQTTRTPSIYGVVSFSNLTTWNNVSNSHYINGYARKYGTSTFTFPVGDGGIYAPALVTPSVASGVDCAYFRSTPAQNTSLATSVTRISSLEFWNIQAVSGATGVVTLTWRSTSDILSLTNGSLNDLTIVAYNNTTSLWEIVPSTIDATSVLGGTSTFNAGSITANSTHDLTNYTHFTLGSKVEDCSALITSSGQTRTWNGSWSATPTISDNVIINAPYSGGSFSCYTLELNADVTLSNGQFIDVYGDVTGNSKIIMSSESSVVQRTSSGLAPKIELTKTSREMRRNDYIYWGTPISGDFFSQLADAKAHTATLAGAFDLKYKWNAGVGGWLPLTSTVTGNGYIMRVKNQAPFTSLTATDNIDLKFTGTANNGVIPVAVTHDPLSSANASSRRNLLANPYPSAINIDKFLLENEDIDGYVALWTAATPTGNNNNNITSYTQADYVVYNLAGEVSTNPIGVAVNGKVASGQGFMVKSINPTGNGQVEFNNCMRIIGPNNNFFRTANSTTEVKDRFKLNLTDTNGTFSQILIAYLPNATLGYDRLYDADRSSSSTKQLYSILDSSGRRLSINGRPSFFDTDVVPLGVSKTTTDSETFSISIVEQEGIFATNNATVYLYDKALQVYHELATGPYTFTTSQAVENTRFEVVYINNALSNPDFNNLNVFATLKNNAFTAQASLGMNEIEIYDITGRKILSFNAEGNTNTTKTFYHSDGVYIAKIKLDNGSVVTQKLINQK